MHCGVHCRLIVSLVFGEVFFVGSASLHGMFLHFLAKCFFCITCFGVFFGGGNKCVGVNVCGVWCLNGMCLRMLCVVGISICTPVGIKKAFACMCMGGMVL